MSARPRRRTGVTVAVSAVAGAVLGIGGTSLALWNDTVEVTGRIATGYEHFAVGTVGDTVPASGRTATVRLGPDEARTLLDDGEVAVPLQVDSLSQGNKGLRYEVALPTSWGAGVFASSEVSFFAVDDPAACSVDLLTPESVPVDAEHASTPVPAEYTAGSDPTTEFWCLYAAFTGPPELGDYANTATVTADSPADEEVSDEDSWDAVVVADLDPAAEPRHPLTFTYSTFRPGKEDTP